MAASFLSMMESKLAPGFRFHPRDEELITDYLAKRISGTGAGDDFKSSGMMEDVDLNKVEPWDLPDNTCVGGKEWYFFCLRDRKYATGQRTNRATLSGYWKATGKDRPVMDGRKGGRLVGMRKTLVFYRGRAPKGKKTDWVMHEFRMELDESNHHHHQHQHQHHHQHQHQQQQQQLESTLHSSCINNSLNNNDWVLCRVFYKSTRGGRIPVDSTVSSKDDASSSSSLPSLIDTYINFEHPSLTNANMQYGFNQERVPCFSTILNGTRLPPPPPMPSTSNTAGRRLLSDATSLWSIPPLTNFAFEEKNANKDQTERVGRTGECFSFAESSDAFLGQQSMWNPF